MRPPIIYTARETVDIGDSIPIQNIADSNTIQEVRLVIVYGVFKAMGDLLCASPVILHELRSGAEVHLLLFPSSTLAAFLSLIDLGATRSQLKVHFLPAASTLSGWGRFAAEMRAIQPDRVWISPHAPKEASSWKIPLALKILGLAYWRGTKISGADSERGAFALDCKIPLNRSLPFIQREWQGYRMAFGGLPDKVGAVRFIPELMFIRTMAPEFDLLIHPGANAKNRSWPVNSYGEVVRLLPSTWRIGVVGLESDLVALRQAMPSDHLIRYKSGTLAEAIATIASTRLLLTMDSGNVHFAQILGVPAVALFGKSDPANVISLNSNVDAVYQQMFPCQPCGKAFCSQPEVYCMNALTPKMVSQRILNHFCKV